MTAGRARTILLVGTIAGALGEALDSLSIGWPALIFAGVFVVGVALLRRGKRAGVIVAGLMMLVEVVAFPSYPRDSATDWLVQVPFLILGLICVTAAALVVLSWRAATS